MKRVAFLLSAVALAFVLLPSASGAPIPLDASPSKINFGDAPINSSATPPVTVTFTNTSDHTVTIAIRSETVVDWFAVEPLGAKFGVGNNFDCEGAILAPGDTCFVELQFQPDTTGRQRATFYLLEDGTLDHVAKVMLSGRGV